MPRQYPNGISIANSQRPKGRRRKFPRDLQSPRFLSNLAAPKPTGGIYNWTLAFALNNAAGIILNDLGRSPPYDPDSHWLFQLSDFISGTPFVSLGQGFWEPHEMDDDDDVPNPHPLDIVNMVDTGGTSPSISYWWFINNNGEFNNVTTADLESFVDEGGYCLYTIVNSGGEEPSIEVISGSEEYEILFRGNFLGYKITILSHISGGRPDRPVSFVDPYKIPDGYSTLRITYSSSQPIIIYTIDTSYRPLIRPDTGEILTTVQEVDPYVAKFDSGVVTGDPLRFGAKDVEGEIVWDTDEPTDGLIIGTLIDGYEKAWQYWESTSSNRNSFIDNGTVILFYYTRAWQDGPYTSEPGVGLCPVNTTTGPLTLEIESFTGLEILATHTISHEETPSSGYTNGSCVIPPYPMGTETLVVVAKVINVDDLEPTYVQSLRIRNTFDDSIITSPTGFSVFTPEFPIDGEQSLDVEIVSDSEHIVYWVGSATPTFSHDINLEVSQDIDIGSKLDALWLVNSVAGASGSGEIWEVVSTSTNQAFGSDPNDVIGPGSFFNGSVTLGGGLGFVPEEVQRLDLMIGIRIRLFVPEGFGVPEFIS